MAKKIVLTDNSGNKCYPVTRDECVKCGDRTLPEKFSELDSELSLYSLEQGTISSTDGSKQPNDNTVRFVSFAKAPIHISLQDGYVFDRFGIYNLDGSFSKMEYGTVSEKEYLDESYYYRFVIKKQDGTSISPNENIIKDFRSTTSQRVFSLENKSKLLEDKQNSNASAIENIINTLPLDNELYKKIEDISWEDGFYAKIDGSINALDTWVHAKIAITEGANILQLTNVDVASTGLIVVLFFMNDGTIRSIVLNKNIENYSGAFPIPLGATDIGINSRVNDVSKVEVRFGTISNSTMFLITNDNIKDGSIGVEKLYGYKSIADLTNETEQSSNLLNPDGWVLDHYDNAGQITADTNYNYIKIDVSSYSIGTKFQVLKKDGTILTMRFSGFYKEDGSAIKPFQANVKEITKSSEEEKSLSVTIFKGNNNFNEIGIFSGDTPNYDDYYKIAYSAAAWREKPKNPQALARIGDLENLSFSNKKEVTILNSDKIVGIGDSYMQSHYTVKDKSWLSKVSMFSDFIFMNYGVSGHTYLSRLDAIRKKTPMYGTIPIVDYKGKYALMCCFTNDIKYMDYNTYLLSLENTIKVVNGLGIEPIVCTEFHTGYSNESYITARTGMRHIADKYGLMFWDIAKYVDLIRGKKDYAPFWGGSHPGSRTNAIESDNYEKFLVGLERPAKSLKLFRIRQGVDYSDLQTLMFGNNYERAKLFKEISVGHSALSNSSLVDNCNADNVVINSEYQKLIKKEAIEFENVCLVSCVLPCYGKDLEFLALDLKTLDGAEVYIMNSIAEPYPVTSSLSRFDYKSLIIKPKEGDKYRGSDGRDYTVVSVIEGIGDGDALGAIFCTPSVGGTNDGGTLTRISGNGDETITYDYRATGYLPIDEIEDYCGNWIKLDKSELNNIYETPSDIIPYSVYVDKVNFIIKKDGAFSISDLSVIYQGSENKSYIRNCPKKLESNYYSTSEELMPSSTFSSVGENDINWNIIPTDIYEKQNGTDTYPKDCISKVTVTDTVSLTTTIQQEKFKLGNGDYILELWCRYFPPVYLDGSGEQITEDSFDYNEIFVEIGTTEGKKIVLKDRVNTHWKIVRFPINVVGIQDVQFKIYSNEKGIELSYISLKEKIRI